MVYSAQHLVACHKSSTSNYFFSNSIGPFVTSGRFSLSIAAMQLASLYFQWPIHTPRRNKLVCVTVDVNYCGTHNRNKDCGVVTTDIDEVLKLLSSAFLDQLIPKKPENSLNPKPWSPLLMRPCFSASKCNTWSGGPVHTVWEEDSWQKVARKVSPNGHLHCVVSHTLAVRLCASLPFEIARERCCTQWFVTEVATAYASGCFRVICGSFLSFALQMGSPSLRSGSFFKIPPLTFDGRKSVHVFRDVSSLTIQLFMFGVHIRKRSFCGLSTRLPLEFCYS